MVPPHCVAQNKCWECYQGWYARVSARDLDLAHFFLKSITNALPLNPSVEDLQRVRIAVDYYIHLQTRQWREMTRSPFIFETKETAKPKPTSLDDIAGMFK